MTVAQMIEWLQTLPQDATVETMWDYYNSEPSYKPVDIDSSHMIDNTLYISANLSN